MKPEREGTLIATVDQLQAEVDTLWRLTTVLALCVLGLAVIGLVERLMAAGVIGGADVG